MSIDWKVEKGANSGIFLQCPLKRRINRSTALLLKSRSDNEHASDNRIDSHLAGSLYDMLPADPKSVNPYGEWNRIVIRVNCESYPRSKRVKVVEYRLWTKEWNEMVKNSKFKDFRLPERDPKSGHIGLQDHGYTIWFRNVKLKPL